MDRSASQDATQRSEGSPPATDPLPRPTSAAESRGMHAQQQRELQSHQPARLQQLGTSGPPRPSSSSPPQQMRVSTDETFSVGEAFGGNGRAGAIHSAEEEGQSSCQTLQLQPQHSSPSPGEIFRAEAGGVDVQQRAQAPSHPHHPQQPQLQAQAQQQGQPQLQQAHPQHQPGEALTQAPLSDQPEAAQQQQQQQQQQPWPQQQAVQPQREMSAQQQQQQLHQQPQPQAQARTEAERWKPSASLLSGYVPPVANTQVDVPVLMQQTSAAIARWGDLQKNLDVRSDTATGNLAAQAQARSSLKRDLTNLTQLADAQTRHIQRMKARQIQTLHVTKPPSQGWFPPGGGSAGSALTPTGTPGGVARGGVTGEGFSFSPKPQVLNQTGASPAAAMRAASIAPPSHAASGSMGAVLMQQGASRSGVPPHTLSVTARGDGAEDVRTPGRTSEWAQMTASSSQPSALSSTPSPPPLQQPQHALPSQQRMQVVKEHLDRTEPRNKWVVLVDASLRLSPDEGPMFKHLCTMIQGFLSNYNGAVGAEVAQALRSCLDPRVFDAMNIKRSQERLADVYSRWAQRGGR